MAIARTGKRLGLRTEASARFERGFDPWGLERAGDRFCELLAGSATTAPGVLHEEGEVPAPLRLAVPVARVNELLGTDLNGEAVAGLLEPLGFGCEPQGATLAVTVPTNRPDVRPAPFGVADVVEEVGRAYGYSALPRRYPAWPAPGRSHPLPARTAPGARRPGGGGRPRGVDRHLRRGRGPRPDRVDRSGGAGGQPAGQRRGAAPAQPAARAARRPGVQRRPPTGRGPAL